MKNCIFCKIIKEEITSSKVYEDEYFIAFMDIQPINSGHVLVIPKIHQELIINLLDDNLVKGLMYIGCKISKAMRKSNLKPEGVNFFLADGEAAGQEISHVHLHVIPRFKNDGFGFVFPKSYGRKPEKVTLDKIARDISSNLR